MRAALHALLAFSLILNGSGFLHVPRAHAAMSPASVEEPPPCHDQAPADQQPAQHDCCASGSGCVCAASAVAAVDAAIARSPAPEHVGNMNLRQSGEPLCGPDSFLRPPIA